MKTSLKLTLTLFLAVPAALQAGEKQPAQTLDTLPAPVRDAVTKAAGDGLVEEVKTTTADGRSIHLVEIELKDGRDLNLRVAEDGRILKSVEEIHLSAAPEPVRAALEREKQAAGAVRVDDLEKVTLDGAVSWRAELERGGKPDLKMRLDPQGAVLEKKEARD